MLDLIGTLLLWYPECCRDFENVLGNDNEHYDVLKYKEKGEKKSQVQIDRYNKGLYNYLEI